MKQILFFIFYLSVCTTAKAQRSYAEAMQQGDDAVNNGEYKNAINKYFAAEAFDPTKKDSVKARLSKTFDAIENLRKKAEADEALANKRKTETDSLLKEAKKQTEKALKEKQKLQKLNEFTKYNNGQVFANIKIKDSLLLDLKLREYKLSVKYDSAIDDAYRFKSFYDLSNYYLNNKKISEALNWADSMCIQYPGEALSFDQRSIVNYYLSDWEHALVDVDSAINKNDDSFNLPLLTWNKALILVNLRRYKEASRWITKASKLLKKRWYKEDWCDYVLQGEIDSLTNIKAIYMELKEQKAAMEIYATVNNVYAGSAPISVLKKKIGSNSSISVLLSIINYTNTHMKAQPADYIGYLVNGFFWELANEPKLSEKNYSTFLRAHQKAPNKKYTRYKNNFSSPIYNKLKK